MLQIAGKGKPRGREEDGLRDPEEHETWLKKPAWLATTTAEYHGGQEPSTGDEVDELEPEHGDSSDSDVKVSDHSSVSAQRCFSHLGSTDCRFFQGQGQGESRQQGEEEPLQGKG